MRGPWLEPDLTRIGIEPDFLQINTPEESTASFAWHHRRTGDVDLYFISNQSGSGQSAELSFRTSGRRPELWNPLTGSINPNPEWFMENGWTMLDLQFPPGGSLFVVFREPTQDLAGEYPDPLLKEVLLLDSAWEVTIDPAKAGPFKPVMMQQLSDWQTMEDPAVRFYSGTAVYKTRFRLDEDAAAPDASSYLDLGTVHDVAEVILNGSPCGVAWTIPMRVEVTGKLRPGKNELSIEVTNTWANRLIGDHLGHSADPPVWTRAPYRLGDGPLLPAGLLGPVTLLIEE